MRKSIRAALTAALTMSTCLQSGRPFAADTPIAQSIKSDGGSTKSPFAVTGVVQDLAKTLDDNGIRLNVTLLDNFIANPDSGIQPGHQGNLAIWGLRSDFDLGKVLGWQGATLHHISTLDNLFYDQNVLAQTGGNLGTLPYFKYHKPYVLSLLSLEQTVGGLDIEVGRTNLLRYFWTNNFDDAFACVPGVYWSDTPAMSISYATWGGVASYHFTPRVYLKAGAFEDDFFNLNTNGFHFRDNTSTGHILIGEGGYTSTFVNSRYPARYEIGFFNDTTEHTNQYLSALGRPVLLHPKDPAHEENGPVALFAEDRQTVWSGARRPSSIAPPPNLALYIGWFQTLNAEENFTSEAWIGSSVTGVIPGRPLDHFGLRFHYLQLGNNFAQSETLARKIAGGSSRQSRNEYAVELSYNVQVARGVTFVPDVQYLINQDTLYNPKSKIAPRDGIVVNADLVVSFGDLLGLPTLRL